MNTWPDAACTRVSPWLVLHCYLIQQRFHFCFETSHSRLLSRWAALSFSVKDPAWAVEKQREPLNAWGDEMPQPVLFVFNATGGSCREAKGTLQKGLSPTILTQRLLHFLRVRGPQMTYEVDHSQRVCCFASFNSVRLSRAAARPVLSHTTY